MADTAPASTTDAPDTPTDATTDAPADTADETVDWKGEAEKWKTQARKHEDRAKTNASAAKELEQLRQQSMSDTEKAVAQARAEGRTEAIKEAAGKMAAAEIRIAAAGRLSDQQVATLVDGVNLAAFVADDGDVDAGKVREFVDGIAPPASEATVEPAWPDLAQGARGGNGKVGNDPLLAHVKNVVGIK